MKKFIILLCLLVTSQAFSRDITVKMYTTANHTPIGKIDIEQTKHGLLFKPSLSSLTPGIHGFHIHENHSCADNGRAAGGHWDPQKTGKHLGPYRDGHKGDLPPLFVNKAGESHDVVLAPRLHLKDIRQRSIMIHQNGDNYSDSPKPMGGGGERIACGVIS